VEQYKESVPRADLLRLADEVVTELRVSQAGQYQLTELLLCDAIDRHIFRVLKLPGYRAWAAQRRDSFSIRIAPVQLPPSVEEAREEEEEVAYAKRPSVA